MRYRGLLRFHAVIAVFAVAICGRSLACPVNGGNCICESIPRSVTCSRMTGLQYRLPVGIPSDTLQLSINKSTLKKIGPTAFRTTRSLTDVDLSSNRIETISEISLQPLTNIRNLSLGNNRLKLIPESLFIRSTSLTKLNLNGNNILVLVPHNFRGLESLEELSLLRNPTMCIALDAFSGLPQLQKLEMSGMNATLDSSLFKELKKLKILALRRFFHVKTIPRDLFRNNLRLEKLYLEDIPLAGGLSEDLLVPLKHLHTLSLSDCGFTNIPVKVLLAVKDSLTALDMSHNPLIKITRYDFKSLRNLKVLKLGHTGLTMIPTNALALPLLTALDLSGNMLTTLQRSALGNDHTQLRNVTLGNNPWICDCELKWLADEKFFHSPDIPVVCSLPPGMQGFDIRFAPRPLPKGEYFQCEKPKITGFGISPDGLTNMLVGDNVPIALDAPCVASGYPRPYVTWILPPFSKSMTRKRRSANEQENMNAQSNGWDSWMTSLLDSPKYRPKRADRSGEDDKTCTVCDTSSRHVKDDIWVSEDATLHIRDLSSDLAVGVYTCQAINGYGTTRRSFVIAKGTVESDEQHKKGPNTPVANGFKAWQPANENIEPRIRPFESEAYDAAQDWPRFTDQVDNSGWSGKNSNFYYYYPWMSSNSKAAYSNWRAIDEELNFQHRQSQEPPSRLERRQEENPALPLQASPIRLNHAPIGIRLDSKWCRVMQCNVVQSEDTETDRDYPGSMGGGKPNAPHNVLSSKSSVGDMTDRLTRSQISCCNGNAGTVLKVGHLTKIVGLVVSFLCLTELLLRGDRFGRGK